MPANEVSDPITDQEVAFAHLVLSATMTDRQAAEVAGLNPDTAADTKAKPRVRDYMLEHRALVPEQFVQTERLGQMNIAREQVLTRLWEIAKMGPELTRNSITGQVKALSMIIAVEGLIPDRRARSASDKQSAPSPTPAKMYASAWLREQQGNTNVPQPSPDLVPDEDSDPSPSPSPDATSDPVPVSPAPETTPLSPYARVPGSAPDHRPLPLQLQMNPFGRRR